MESAARESADEVVSKAGAGHAVYPGVVVRERGSLCGRGEESRWWSCGGLGEEGEGVEGGLAD